MDVTKVFNKKFFLPVLFLVLALIAGGYYWLAPINGSEDLAEKKPASQSMNMGGEANANSTKVESVDTLLEGLRRRLETEGGDAGGWALLAKSYYHLQRWDEATAAFKKAKALGYEGEPLGQPLAARNVPRHQLTPFNPLVKTNLLAQQIIETTTKPAAEQFFEVDEARITVKVMLDPKIVEKIEPDTIVYIFALPSESANKAPLAVMKKRVVDFPLEIVMEDSMAMIPGHNISSVQNVLVGARVSISGNPIRQNGDFEKLSDSFSWVDQKKMELIVSDQIGAAD